jgi:hypothetical protein
VGWGMRRGFQVANVQCGRGIGYHGWDGAF